VQRVRLKLIDDLDEVLVSQTTKYRKFTREFAQSDAVENLVFEQRFHRQLLSLSRPALQQTDSRSVDQSNN